MPGASGVSSAIGATRQRAAEHALDRFARQTAGAQQVGCAEAGDDGELHADRRTARRRSPFDAAAQVGEHVRGAGRRNVAGAVRRGRHHRPAEGFEQLGATGCAGTRTATLSRPASARSATVQSGCFGSTSVSGPGQNAAASFSAAALKRADAPRRGDIRDMGDQRIERGPALGGIEPGHGLAVAGIGAEPVDRLGRKGDQPAGGEAARRRLDRPASAFITRVPGSAVIASSSLRLGVPGL